MTTNSSRRLPAAVSLIGVLLLGGCATLTQDAGFGAVQSAARERGLQQEAKWLRDEKDREAARASIKKLLDAPLSLVTTWPHVHKVHHSRVQTENDSN